MKEVSSSSSSPGIKQTFIAIFILLALFSQLGLISKVIQSYLKMLEAAIGLKENQSAIFFCLLFSYALAYVQRYLLPTNQPDVKHLFNFAAGVFCGYVYFGMQVFHVVFVCLMSYFSMLFFGKQKAGPILVYIFSLGYLSAAHIYRQYKDYQGLETTDFTAPLMMQAIKLSSLSLNIYDGHKYKNRVFTDEERKSKSVEVELSEYAIYRMPTLFEYLGYCFFFAGFLTGPAFEFKEYYLHTNLCDMHREKDAGKRQEVRDRVSRVCTYNDNYERVPDSVGASLKELVVGIVFAVGVVAGGKFPVSWCGSEEFTNNTSFLYKIAYTMVSVETARWKYYAAWTLANGSCIMTGVGYNKFVKGKAITFSSSSSENDKKEKKPSSGNNDSNGEQENLEIEDRWDRVANVNIWGLETATNYKEITDSWNIRTGIWLRRYCYLRVGIDRNGKPSPWGMAVTYFVSSFWHGFYPGYYLMFLSGGILTHISKELRRALSHRFVGTVYEPFYTALAWFCAQLSVDYIAVMFLNLHFYIGWAYWKSMYFSGHIIIFSIMFFFVVVPSKKLSAARSSSYQPASASAKKTN
eukprot:Nk52_evm39s2118 gene=Nk52_evmTU39s2118